MLCVFIYNFDVPTFAYFFFSKFLVVLHVCLFMIFTFSDDFFACEYYVLHYVYYVFNVCNK